MVSEVSEHHCGEGVAEQSSLPHGGQEAKKERMPVLADLIFLPFYSVRDP
jgi:hypothetical protein